jgi:hypothetical protein
MLKLKSATPSLSIKNGSFEKWVLDVVANEKNVGAESTLPSHMCLGLVTSINGSPVSSNKSKDTGKTKVEDEDVSGCEHHTVLSTIILNETDHEFDWI